MKALNNPATKKASNYFLRFCLCAIVLIFGTVIGQMKIEDLSSPSTQNRTEAVLANYTVTSLTDDVAATANDGTLRGAILASNQDAGAAAITFNIAGGGTITLARMLPLLVNPNGINIDGANGGQGAITVSGNNAYRIFFVGVSPAEITGSATLVSTASATFSISNMKLNNGRAQGGNGGSVPGLQGGGGAGGGGLGGAIFLNAGTLNISNVDFLGSSAIGGNGGNGSTSGSSNRGAGGGGMGGNGGNSNTNPGGGGGFGPGADGGSAGGAGVAGLFTGGTGRNGASGGNCLGVGGITGGGGGGGNGTTLGGAGGGVGGLGGTGISTTGKAGGFGGGGGGGGTGSAGPGGYGGGGGGNSNDTSGGGGRGGFGGGGGGSRFVQGSAGFGGGTGKNPGGGGGAGLAAAVFVRQGAILNVTDGSFSGGTTTGGTAGNNGTGGQGIGKSLFLAGQATFTVTSGTLVLADDIGGGTDALITGGLTMSGAGKLQLTGANTNTGPTNVNGGTLALSGNGSFAGSTPINVAFGAILDVSGVTGGANFNNGKFSLASGQTLGGNGTMIGATELRSGSTLAVGTNPGQLTFSNDLSLVTGSTFKIKIGGTTPITQHDQIVAGGALDLGNATLTLTQFNGFVPLNGQQFKIIDKTSAGPITGTFNNVAEGATINNFLGLSGYTAQITYTGGDGNDVVLTAFAPQADLEVVAISASPDPIIAGTNLTYTINFQNNGPSAAAAVTVTNAVPAGTGFVSASVTTGTGWSAANPSPGGSGNVVFSKGSVTASETAVFTIVVNVDPAATGSISDTATAASTTGDLNTLNNSKSATTNILSVFTTVAAGNWSDGSTWFGGFAPPASMVTGGKIQILHNVSQDLDYALSNGATLEIGTAGNLTVMPGRTLTNNGLLKNSGALTNNGTLTDAGVTTFDGAAMQTVDGTAAPSFNKLIINNPAGVTFSTNASVADLLTLTSGIVTMSGTNALTIGALGSISRTSGYVIGTVKKEFPGIGSFTFPVGTALGYTPVTAVVDTLGGGDFSVMSNDGFLVNTDHQQSIARNWTLEGNGLNHADVTVTYLDADVPAGANESGFQFIRRSGTVSTAFAPTTMDPGTNTFSLVGITAFSKWALGNLINPTAAPAKVAGRVTKPDGAGLSKASVTITDMLGRSRTAVTNPFGYFFFDEVETGQQYVVQVNHKSYLFNPAFIFVANDITDLNIAAFAQSRGVGNGTLIVWPR
jgi:uncharacterized repeat protein (TIGR01451 family)